MRKSELNKENTMNKIKFVNVTLNEYNMPFGMDEDGNWWLWSGNRKRWERGLWTW
jgi:hypothetical protein